MQTAPNATTDENDEEYVLNVYRKTNRAPRPPLPEQLCDHAQRQTEHNTDQSPSADHPENIGSDDDESDVSEVPVKKKRRTRTTQPPSPDNLSYYSDDWRAVLKRSQEEFIHYVATQNAFPECSTDLGEAEAILKCHIERFEDAIGELQGSVSFCFIGSELPLMLIAI